MARHVAKAASKVAGGMATAEILPASTRKLAESIAKSPKRSRNFLIEAGIITKGGRLSSKYK